MMLPTYSQTVQKKTECMCVCVWQDVCVSVQRDTDSENDKANG